MFKSKTEMQVKDRRILFFMLKAIVLLVCWLVVEHFWLDENSIVNHWMVERISTGNIYVLEMLGYETFMEGTISGIQGTSGVHIARNCNGLSLFALFAGLLIVLPGKIIHKTWFIPLGISMIHFLNIFRVSMLSVLALYKPEWIAFNHKYTFTLFIYAVIFVCWMIWVNFFMHVRK